MKFIDLLKYLFFIALILIFLTVLFAIIKEIFIQKKRGNHIAKQGNYKKNRHWFLRLFYDFPKRVVADLYSCTDYEFKLNGLHLIVGEQGSGKTIALVYLLLKFAQKYPKLVIRTNMGYVGESGSIKSWRDLVFRNNGVYGEIDVIDEIQNWFNSLESKDFPPEMFSEITQQRKQRKCIFGTSQVWQRVAKPIREQCSYVYKPHTFLGAITFVLVYKPKVNDDGICEKLMFRKMFFFVHNDEIRNSFDTYKKIKSQSLKGFKSETDRNLMKGNILANMSPTDVG